jgi:ferrochelatase
VKTAVVLMAYGSPSRPEDVRAYFEDIRGGPVPEAAVEELAERYRRIGGSPLNEITERQRAALEHELGMPVYVGMKHWHPRIAEAAERAVSEGAQRVIGLVLAPHFARMSIGAYHAQLEKALAGKTELVFIASYHAFEPFLDVVADRVRGQGRKGHVVFTAHSLPERVLREGSSYRDELLESSRLVADRAGVESWSFAFQSESATGEPWLGPDILDELERLQGEGVRKVLVAPIGFVADHLEILWDIDVEAREKAAELGLELDRTESLNDDPAFIRVLAALVREVPVYKPRIPVP